MENIIYDERTPHSRLMVGYDRHGLRVREWSENNDEGKTPFIVSEGYFTWKQYRERERVYSMDVGEGRLKDRLIRAAISMLAYWGGSSDNEGEVESLDEYVNGHHRFTC